MTLLYDKNFLRGEAIFGICQAAVFESFVTVVVVSNTFLQSRWCNYEMLTAVEAGFSIIPPYLNKCQEEQLCDILKFIYDSKVRLLWPQTNSDNKGLSAEELELICNLATSVTACVRKFDSEICNV